MTLDRTADGQLDLSARAVPLADVLECLVERVGLRVEYEGPPPRQPVSVTLRGESLAGTLESLLEGLGVNYLLTRDSSGADRLIVFGASKETEPSRGGAPRPSPATGQPEAVAPPESGPEDESRPFGPPPGSPGMVSPFPMPPGSDPSAIEAPAEEPSYVPEPQELTPLTLQLGRGVGKTVASMAGNSPVR